MTSALEHIEVALIVNNEAGCEVEWDTGRECGKPAVAICEGHSASEHNYVDARICRECLTKARKLGFDSPLTICRKCLASPLMRNVRPI